MTFFDKITEYWQFIFSAGIPILLIPTLVDLKYDLIWSYQAHKFLHLLGVIMFMGNIVVSAIWMSLAIKSEDKKVLSFSAKSVDRMDIYFTAPGAFLILTNGLMMADSSFNGVYDITWIRDALFALIGSTAIWLFLLVRYQAKMIRISSDPEFDAKNGEFNAIFRNWLLWGVVATVLPLAAVYLMVFKP